MSNDRWKPSVTVAAVVEQGGRYLLVEERTPEGLRFAERLAIFDNDLIANSLIYPV